MSKERSYEKKAKREFARARYFAKGVPYHITSKTLRGEFFLQPSALVNDIIKGVLARAQKLWPALSLYAFVFLANHFHWLLDGDGKDDLASYQADSFFFGA